MWDSTVRENLEAIERRIDAACRRAGRSREEVTLVAVTKSFPAAAVEAAIAAGIGDIGENRVQELRDKRPQVGAAARWHLIGHLQSNKAKAAVELADVIQTVDSLSLAERIARFAREGGRTIDVMIQVNVGLEAQKSGIAASEAVTLARGVNGLEGIHLTGVMTVPPIASDEETRRNFRKLRAVRDELRERVSDGIAELSMGMTDDFEIAVEEGATLLRLGRAIFGGRD